MHLTVFALGRPQKSCRREKGERGEITDHCVCWAEAQARFMPFQLSCCTIYGISKVEEWLKGIVQGEEVKGRGLPHSSLFIGMQC